MRWTWTILTIAAAFCVWGNDHLFVLHLVCCVLLLGEALREARAAMSPAVQAPIENKGGSQS